MNFIGRLGKADVIVAAGQTITINSFGAGITKVYTGTPNTAGNLPVNYALSNTLTNASVTIVCATATAVQINASVACDVSYSIGSAQLTQGSAQDALTALAGGGQTGATPLLCDFNRVTTVATAADSVMLPAALPGLQVTVINAAASNSMTVYPQTGEIINALSANTGLATVANKAEIFTCAVAGKWQSLLTA